MTDVQSIVKEQFGSEEGELLISGVRVSEITEKYGTPLFIYDAGVMERKLKLLRSVLPSGFDVYYSIKANSNQRILKFFVSEGRGLEVASSGEFDQALKAGCPPERILFAGPGKTESELDFVLKQGIGEIHIESLHEIEMIAAICRRLGIQANIAIRVNPGEEAQGGAMRMGGKPSPFGVDQEILDSVVDRVMKERNLVFRGVHLFTGTQILDDDVLIRQYRQGIEIASRAAARSGILLHTLDFGGGLGIPYFKNEEELNIRAFGGKLSSMISEIRKRPEFERTNFIIEPGRYLVGECGIYVSRIISIKKSRGKKFLIIDGGMNHHLAASGNLGQVIKRNFPVALLNKIQDEPGERVDVVGPLCTPLDLLARDVKLPHASLGDLIGIFQSGAYARTASPLGFLSHPTPPEVWVQKGELQLIRKRGTREDFYRDQVSS